jgi:hypothetical protein
VQLFVDDVRELPEGWVLVRTADAAVADEFGEYE